MSAKLATPLEVGDILPETVSIHVMRGRISMSKTPCWVSMGLVTLICMTGCGSGSDAPPKASVHGTVSFDGTPIDKGQVTFQPTGGTKGPAAYGQIENGRYSVPEAGGAVVGKSLVSITWQKKTGKTDAGGVEETAEGLPAKFNTESTLEVTIAAGDNTHDFELKSK